jgi:hypothetical protein
MQMPVLKAQFVWFIVYACMIDVDRPWTSLFVGPPLLHGFL